MCLCVKYSVGKHMSIKTTQDSDPHVVDDRSWVLYTLFVLFKFCVEDTGGPAFCEFTITLDAF